MKEFKAMQFDAERALYGSHGVTLTDCKVTGEADGESILKESSDITVNNCFFNLRYPFWHDRNLTVNDSEMTPNCRAALWYSDGIRISRTTMHGIKALRECSDIYLEECDIDSPEFGWFNVNVTARNVTAKSEYFMMRSKNLDFADMTLNGKYSFQYIEDSKFERCLFNTKDSLWHAKNVTLRDCEINGEYLAWYCENVTFINCKIKGTQPLCYCKNITLVDCVMEDADLSFEKSSVSATVLSDVISIKNPASGTISVKSVGEIIRDDDSSRAEIIITGESK